MWDRIVLFWNPGTGLVACEAVSASARAGVLHSVFTSLGPPECFLSSRISFLIPLLPNSCRFIGLKWTLMHQEAFSCLNCNIRDVISLLSILEATCSSVTGRDGILGPSKQCDFREKRYWKNKLEIRTNRLFPVQICTLSLSANTQSSYIIFFNFHIAHRKIWSSMYT